MYGRVRGVLIPPRPCPPNVACSSFRDTMSPGWNETSGACLATGRPRAAGRFLLAARLFGTRRFLAAGRLAAGRLAARRPLERGRFLAPRRFLAARRLFATGSPAETGFHRRGKKPGGPFSSHPSNRRRGPGGRRRAAG